MKKRKTDLFWIHAYMILSVIGIFLFAFSEPNMIHFIGASSVVQAFLFGLGQESGLLVLLLWLWALLSFVGLIWSYLYAFLKKKTLPFFVLTGIDLLFSLFAGIWCLIQSEWLVLSGFAVRLLYYLLMIWQTKKTS